MKPSNLWRGMGKWLAGALLSLALLLIFALFFMVLLAFATVAFFILLFSRRKLTPRPIALDRLRPGDIVLTGTNSMASFQIKMANILTNGMDSKYWTHVAVHVGGGNLIEAQTHGVQFNTIGHYQQTGALIRVFRHKYLRDEAFFAKVVAYCRAMEAQKCKYGWGAVLFYTLSIAMPDICDWVFDNRYVDTLLNLDNSFFCSELAATAYQEAGARISQFDNWRIKPSDFIWNPLFEEAVDCYE